MVRSHGEPEHMKTSSATRRAGSPTSSQPLLHVMPLKSIGPSNISGFPTVTPCDPQQGFVSRPGGAFKFRSVQQITQSKQTNALNVAPKNPYQELRTLTHAGAHRASTSHAASRSSLSASAVRSFQGASGASWEGDTRSDTEEVTVLKKAMHLRLPATDSTSLEEIFALKQLHKSLSSISASEQKDREIHANTHLDAFVDRQQSKSESDELDAIFARDSELLHEQAQESRACAGEMQYDRARPNTSMGFSAVTDEPSFVSMGSGAGSSRFDDILPGSMGRRSASRTPALMWLQKLTGEHGGKRGRVLPYGALSNERINAEASRVFGQVGDDAMKTEMSGVSKFVEAHALDLRLQNAFSNGNLILQRPPLTEAKQKFYVYIIPELFAVFDVLIDAVGPFSKVLKDLRDELHKLIYSSEKDFSHSEHGEGLSIPFVHLVGELKRHKEKLDAARNTQEALMKKAMKDNEQRFQDNQDLRLRVNELEQELKKKDFSLESVQFSFNQLKDQYTLLNVKFHEMQKGFLLGQLQDEMKDLLLGDVEEDKLGDEEIGKAREEQSAMQKLIQQLKDSRQAMLNAQDDMKFWQGKYKGLELRVKNMQESFQDAISSLELTKDKMHNMVPSETYLALQDRYCKVLRDLGRNAEAKAEKLKMAQKPDVVKKRDHDDWKLYDEGEEEEEEDNEEFKVVYTKEEQELMMEMGNTDEVEKETVPKDFILSVANIREKLNQTYRNYRKIHNTSIVSWMNLKMMTLAELARLEHDCFSKHSIWALALMRNDHAAAICPKCQKQSAEVPKVARIPSK